MKIIFFLNQHCSYLLPRLKNWFKPVSLAFGGSKQRKKNQFFRCFWQLVFPIQPFFCSKKNKKKRKICTREKDRKRKKKMKEREKVFEGIFIYYWPQKCTSNLLHAIYTNVKCKATTKWRIKTHQVLTFGNYTN